MAWVAKRLRQVACRSAQCVLEYAVLIAIIAAACVAMHTYVRRAMQANLKNLELELNAVK